MKKIFLLASLLITNTSFAYELHEYNEVMAAIILGKTIHILVDFLKCSTPNNERAQTMSVAAFTPNVISVIDDHIATSLLHFTMNNPNFPDRPVYEFTRYTLSEDNTVTLNGTVLDAVHYTPLSNKFSFTCKIDSGVKIYS